MYLKKPYDERMSSLNDLTFSMVYAYSENYILPVSHNEVYRNGGSLLECIQMEKKNKNALLRALYAYIMCHPGKKMMYMNHDVDSLMSQMNRLYTELPALHEMDMDSEGFEWNNCIDHNDGILSFYRKSDNLNDMLLVVANFSKEKYENYILGVSEEGKYTEIFNSNMKQAGGTYNLSGIEIATEEEYFDGRNNTLKLTLQPLSVAIYSYKPFTKEELLAIAEKKVELLRAKLEKEALEKAEAIEKMSLKENLESKVHEAQKKIADGAEAEKEVKVIRKKSTSSKITKTKK